jgi:hypothetical protein
MNACVKTVGQPAGKVNYEENTGKTSVFVVMKLLYVLQRRVCVYSYNLFPTPQ